MRREKVAIVRSEGDMGAAVRQAIALAGGLPSVRGKSVVLKPNLMCAARSGTGQITDARVTEGVAQAALEAGARFTIAEGSAVGFVGVTDYFDTLEAAEVSGHMDVARRLGIPFVDLNREAFEETPVPAYYGLPTVPVPHTILRADMVISIPVFKAHGYVGGLTVACKNLQGIMPWRNKRRTHRAELEAGLSDIYAAVRPGYAVIDAITARCGQEACPWNLIIAGWDSVAVDATCYRMVGYKPDRCGVLRFNAERGFGVIADEQIEITGLPLSAVQTTWPWMCAGAFKQGLGTTWIIRDDMVCSACAYAASVGSGYVKTVYGADALKGLRIALGADPTHWPREKVDMVIGDCASSWAHGRVYVSGKVPLPPVVATEICRLQGLDVQKIVEYRRSLPESDWEEFSPCQSAAAVA